MKRLKGVKKENAFNVHEGNSIHSLYDLAETLKSMPTESFKHHVSETKNDFASWVRDVFEDSVLAARLSSRKTRTAMENAVRARIKELEHELMPAHASKKIFSRGIIDFLIGLVIGLVAGILVASFF